MKTLGRWWSDRDIEVVEIKGKAIALDGWNGEEYVKAFEVANESNGSYYDLVDEKTEYSVRPVCEEIDEDEYEIVGYETTSVNHK